MSSAASPNLVFGPVLQVKCQILTAAPLRVENSDSSSEDGNSMMATEDLMGDEKTGPVWNR